jgi:lysozyme family protein
MTDLTALKQANAKRWLNAKLTRGPEFAPVAKRLVANKSRYVSVANTTRVPWYFIAVAHERECSADFTKSLAQGDPWNIRSTHVPTGRGPFKSWEDAAIDALVFCPPYASKNTDWSIGGTLTMLERYNGLGYANKGRPSPYIWAGTDQYVSGKYVADGVYDPNAVDKQLGCAGLLLAMMAIDKSITFGMSEPVVPTTTPAPSITNPAKGSIGATIAGWLSAIFKRNA